MTRQGGLPAGLLPVVAFALAVAFLAISCAAVPGSPPAPRYESLKRAELERLAADNPAEGIEAALHLLANETTLPEDQLKAILVESAAALVLRYTESLARGDFQAARGDARSLRFLAEDPDTASWLPKGFSLESSDATLTARIAEKLWSEGSQTSSLFVFLEALDSGYRDPASLRAFSDRAYKLGNRQVLRRIESITPDSLTPEAKAWAVASVSMAEMRRGTVTIWVNRGIRIDQGIGTPDRVIGSGFFIDSRGFLLTNYHVISSEVDPEYEGYSRLYIRLPGQTADRIPARVVGWDKVLDLALIKVDLVPPYVFSFTGRREFIPGDRIFAIGSPVGLDNTLTAGIVSAVGRRFLPLGEVIQVDAAVNPGNSGGPLLDAEGELAGVVFAGLPRYQGLNFAVPAAWVVRLLPALFRGGEVVHPWLGIAAFEGREGIESVYRHPDGSPAAPASGSLVRVAGRECKTLSEAQAVLLSLDPGTLVPVDVREADETRRTWILLRTRPFSPGETAIQRDLRERLLAPFFGMKVSATGRNAYVIESVLPGTIADEAGLSERDPLIIKDFVVDKEQRALIMSLYVKKRKAGFLESIIQIGTALDLDSFL